MAVSRQQPVALGAQEPEVVQARNHTSNEGLL
jgi:hypothetical protein